MFRRVKIQTADTERFERKPVERITASPNMGLTMDQVRAYRENGWDNRPVQAPSKSVRQIIKTNVCTYFNLVFAIITVLLIAAGAFGDLVFLPIIIANTLIGIVQELNAKRILDKLNVLHAPRTQVTRNGITNPVSSEMLVLDDIVVFHAGTKAGENGEVLTSGGRVLGVTAKGATNDEARAKAFANAEKISFEGMHFRRDIGKIVG